MDQSVRGPASTKASRRIKAANAARHFEAFGLVRQQKTPRDGVARGVI
jgi:hypothetical protein